MDNESSSALHDDESDRIVVEKINEADRTVVVIVDEAHVTPTLPSTRSATPTPPSTRSVTPTLVDPHPRTSDDSVPLPPITFPKTKTLNKQQTFFVSNEVRRLGLAPGHPNFGMVSLENESPWRYPGDPCAARLLPGKQTDANRFFLKPVFLLHPSFWRTLPENEKKLPCHNRADCSGNVTFARVGPVRLVIGQSGPYYIYSPMLHCDECGSQRKWPLLNGRYLTTLPIAVQMQIPIIGSHHNAADKLLVWHLVEGEQALQSFCRRKNDIFVSEFLRLRNLYWTSVVPNLPHIDFGDFADKEKFKGHTIGVKYVKYLQKLEYATQKETIDKLLRSLKGTILKVDSTYNIAKRVRQLGGAHSLLSAMNEHNQVISSALLPDETSKATENFYAGLAARYDKSGVKHPNVVYADTGCCDTIRLGYEVAENAHKDWHNWWNDAGLPAYANTAQERGAFRNSSCPIRAVFPDAEVKLDSWHAMERLFRTVTSRMHPLFREFSSMISNAFFQVDKEDYELLDSAIDNEPTKRQVRRHCRTNIPTPEIIEKRLLSVFKIFLLKDCADVTLFTVKTFKQWCLLRLHVRKGCLSNPLMKRARCSLRFVIKRSTTFRFQSTQRLEGRLNSKAGITLSGNGSLERECLPLYGRLSSCCDWLDTTTVNNASWIQAFRTRSTR